MITGYALPMKNIYRISNSFTICDLDAWEKEHGTKPLPLDANPLDVAEAVALCDADYSTITDKEASRVENKMEDLCIKVALDHCGDDHFVVFHPQEKRFYSFQYPPNR